MSDVVLGTKKRAKCEGLLSWTRIASVMVTRSWKVKAATWKIEHFGKIKSVTFSHKNTNPQGHKLEPMSNYLKQAQIQMK